MPPKRHATFSRLGRVKVTRQTRPWVVEAADGPCPTCRGTGGHPTLNTICPTCHGTALSFRAIEGPTRRPIRYADENAAQIAAANWFGGQPVLYRAIRLDPCPDHSGPECLHCQGTRHVRHQPGAAPVFGSLLPPDEEGIP